MFGWLKPDRLKQLKLAYAEKHEEALDAERNGHKSHCTICHQQAEELLEQLQRLEMTATSTRKRMVRTPRQSSLAKLFQPRMIAAESSTKPQ